MTEKTVKADDQSTKAAKAAKADAASAPAPWQQADYDGPLDGEQAAWRNRHLRRLDEGHATKPAKADAQK